MQPNVIALSAGTRIEDAFRIFEEDQISGAPVINDQEQLIGFLSSRDLTRSEHLRDGHLETQPGDRGMAFEEDDELPIPTKENYSPELLGAELVQDWMNPEVISVTIDASLASICKLMVDEHIHRVVVVDEGTVKGIITTMDIVRHLASASTT